MALNSSDQLRSYARTRNVLIKPVVSEKSYSGNAYGVYTFEVATDSNKVEVRKAVEDLFNVKVQKVNTMNRQGKKIRDRRTGKITFRKNRKFAIVTLTEGETIKELEV